ncbi:tRNA dihydrouridine synthase DusB [Dermatobacter hominis]|uniref:tRNA dihydrouridine synthase DusB n=1 Tax=Dermatobacter hominis TaxID=2884263 RepID=UPI001D0F65DF|nr:tRNA dihydrouridine synthase DusB [Dermatobacter hominis]UDY35399.1 tRNA dihydrouridine synthase DusB [Dermatobacter hominis]
MPEAVGQRAAPLSLGPITVDPPVVLAPMAGVTDAPFRVLCAEFGGGLYVNQMVTARALVERHPTTWALTRFHPSEPVRSLQLYGTDPGYLAEAVRELVGEGLVDHLDLNFGCPAAKVTRNGGGAALAYKRRLLRRVVAAVVGAADAESGGRVPVTVKFRMGIDDDHLTFLDTARTSIDEGAAWVALHARTALQHYAPSARWEAIAELAAAVDEVPVLGNGDVFTADDALRMLERTGCDGVVVGRGCLGRPWLFGQLDDALAGRPVRPEPTLGEVVATIRRHVALIVEWAETTGDGLHTDGPLLGQVRLAPFRKHLAWYLKGYPVGGDVRQRAGHVGSLADLDALLEPLEAMADVMPVADPASIARSHHHALKRVALPDGWLDDPDEDVLLPAAAEALVSGG